MTDVPLNSLDGLIPNDVVLSLAEHDGSPALRLVLTPDAETPDNPTFAMIDGLAFRDGTIEIEVAGRTLPDVDAAGAGAIGLYIDSGTEGFFHNLKVTTR